jgi:hypothetical protein
MPGSFPQIVQSRAKGLFEKAADCLKVWCPTQQRINQVVITIDGSREVGPLHFNAA